MMKQCLAEPWRPHYGGGLIVNPEFDDGIEGWTVFGQGAIREGTSHNGNKYIIAHSRTQSLDSFSQKVQLEKGKFYSFSGNLPHSVKFNTTKNWLCFLSL